MAYDRIQRMKPEQLKAQEREAGTATTKEAAIAILRKTFGMDFK